MHCNRLAVLAGGLAALTGSTVATPAMANPQGVTATELARATITEPLKAVTAGPADAVVQKVLLSPGGVTPWHTHPGGTFVAVKTGALTFVRAAAGACSTSRHPAGAGFFVAAGEVQQARNDGDVPAEIFVTYTGVPAGAEEEEHAPAPAGTGCPPEAHGAEERITAALLARGRVAEPIDIATSTPSDLSFQSFTLSPGSSGGWHRHTGAALVVVKSGSLTLDRPGGQSGCTTQRYDAGQGYFLTAGNVHQIRNATTAPVELAVTFGGVPKGAEVEDHAEAPSGAGCPTSVAAVPGELPQTGDALARPLTLTGFGLCGAGLGLWATGRRWPMVGRRAGRGGHRARPA
jgi:quercetin dioxygenase-like cupin family protein